MLHFHKEKVIYFCGIPRCASRFIYYQMLASDFISDDIVTDDGKWATFDGKLKIHLTMKEASKCWDLNNVEKRAVIRHPVEWFKSQCKIFLSECINQNVYKNDLVDYTVFKNMLDKIRNTKTFHSNWFTPQINFIDNDTKLFSFENNLLDSIRDLIKIKTNVSYPTENFDNNQCYKDYIDLDLVNNIKTYYAEDLKLWEKL